MDLGGDTTYNILDFFLAADQGFVLTTCEPASYLDAYGFIKTALHRKLTRLFAAGSDYRGQRDVAVQRLIKTYIFSHTSVDTRHMSDLLQQIKQERPAHYDLMRELLDGFRPGTVVTMFETQEQVDELVSRLKKVSAKMLSIELGYFGCIPYEKQIKQSTKDLVPGVAKAPDGVLAKALRRIVLRMEMA
jgi:flagellar biosynthesis protein FlhG